MKRVARPGIVRTDSHDGSRVETPDRQLLDRSSLRWRNRLDCECDQKSAGHQASLKRHLVAGELQSHGLNAPAFEPGSIQDQLPG
jgi:hypothetical protein